MLKCTFVEPWAGLYQTNTLFTMLWVGGGDNDDDRWVDVLSV